MTISNAALFVKARQAQIDADNANQGFAPVLEIIAVMQEEINAMNIVISQLNVNVDLANNNTLEAIKAKDDALQAIANAGMDYPKVSQKMKAEFFGIGLM